MTSATTTTRTTVEHLFEVPTGSPFSDLDVALTWAKHKAAKLGIDISFDDWCKVVSNEDRTAIVVTETRNDSGRCAEPNASPDDELVSRKIAAYEDLLDSLYLYVNWETVTRQLTTSERELFADAVDAVRTRNEMAGGPEFTAVDRPWRG